jgi:hypothetical protein
VVKALVLSQASKNDGVHGSRWILSDVKVQHALRVGGKRVGGYRANDTRAVAACVAAQRSVDALLMARGGNFY